MVTTNAMTVSRMPSFWNLVEIAKSSLSTCQELEDLKASTVRENQRVRNFKRKIELAEQKTERLQNVS